MSNSSRKEVKISGAIEAFREMNLSEKEIADRLKAMYNLSDEEVDEYLCVKA